MKRKSSVMKSFVLVMQFGFNMLVPITLCSLLGVFIYRRTGTAVPLIILFFVGALAGFRNCYVQAKKVYESDKKDKGKSEESQ